MTVSRTGSPAVCRAAQKRAECLAAALDLQTVGHDADRWTVHVLGAYSDGRTLWVQIAPWLEGGDSVILKLSRRATARHAIATLAVLPRMRGHGPRIVPVMCTV